MEEELPFSLDEIFSRPPVINHDLVTSKSLSSKLKEYNELMKNQADGMFYHKIAYFIPNSP
jgi:hypothetical protein